jgi:hypothetical protein
MQGKWRCSSSHFSPQQIWAVIFVAQWCHPNGKNLQYPFSSELDVPQSWCKCFGETKICCPYQDQYRRLSNPSADACVLGSVYCTVQYFNLQKLISDLIFCWPCIIMYHNSVTNFNTLSLSQTLYCVLILYVFWASSVHLQEALH